MHTQHSTLTLNAHRIHIVDFDPATFTPHDMLWLPHHARLQHAGRKRNTEHLAGRIAAVHALRGYGQQQVPDIGEGGEPCWPGGLYGSISHCEHSALALVSARPIGIDIERILSPSLATELESSIINTEEKRVLEASGLPPELALTLAFSAKESGFKACRPDTQIGTNFTDFQLVYIKEGNLLLRLSTEQYQARWIAVGEYVITLCSS